MSAIAIINRFLLDSSALSVNGNESDSHVRNTREFWITKALKMETALTDQSDQGYLCEVVVVGGRNSQPNRGGSATPKAFYVPHSATVGEVIFQFRGHGASFWMADSQLVEKV
jgi:hypothetical protein